MQQGQQGHAHGEGVRFGEAARLEVRLLRDRHLLHHQALHDAYGDLAQADLPAQRLAAVLGDELADLLRGQVAFEHHGARGQAQQAQGREHSADLQDGGKEGFSH